MGGMATLNPFNMLARKTVPGGMATPPTPDGVLGLLAAVLPFISTLVAETFADWLFSTGGFVGLAALLATRGMPGFVGTLLSTVLAILIGTLLEWRPFAGIVTWTLAAFFVAHGITQVLTSLHHRRLPTRNVLRKTKAPLCRIDGL